MTYKVKGNGSTPSHQESSVSPDGNKSKENTDGQQYEAYKQDKEAYPPSEEEGEDEAETLRRKNSEEEADLLKAAVQMRDKEEKLKKQKEEKDEAEKLKRQAFEELKKSKSKAAE